MASNYLDIVGEKYGGDKLKNDKKRQLDLLLMLRPYRESVGTAVITAKLT